ncbi:MAG: DUF3387 domain-containing protein, partial [Magnetococcales bacterium]|nr:DUF3387 domain-containing protein [Magnetococcales bacterium]
FFLERQNSSCNWGGVHICHQIPRLNEALDEESQRAVREGLDEESLAMFDLLAKPNISTTERDQVKQVAKQLLTRVQDEVARIHDWRKLPRNRDSVRGIIHDILFADPTGLPVDCYDEDEVNHRTDLAFRHVFQFMPEPLRTGLMMM